MPCGCSLQQLWRTYTPQCVALSCNMLQPRFDHHIQGFQCPAGGHCSPTYGLIKHLSSTIHGILSFKPLMASGVTASSNSCLWSLINITLEPDYIVELSAVLQNHISGNLTSHFQYVMTFNPGLNLQMAHHVIAKCESLNSKSKSSVSELLCHSPWDRDQQRERIIQEHC